MPTQLVLHATVLATVKDTPAAAHGRPRRPLRAAALATFRSGTALRPNKGTGRLSGGLGFEWARCIKSRRAYRGQVDRPARGVGRAAVTRMGRDPPASGQAGLGRAANFRPCDRTRPRPAWPGTAPRIWRTHPGTSALEVLMPRASLSGRDPFETLPLPSANLFSRSIGHWRNGDVLNSVWCGPGLPR
jgi:hypothetical protein